MASKIEITFDATPNENYFIRLFGNGFYLGLSGLSKFVTQRVQSGQVTIADTLDATIDNYFQALRVDLNASGSFSIERIENGVSITTAEDGVFDNVSEGQADDEQPTGTASFVITQVSSVILLKVADVEYLPATTNPCDNVLVRVTATKTFKDLTAPVVINDVNSDVVEFEVTRGIDFSIGLREGEIGGFTFDGYRAPAPILISDFAITSTAVPTGYILSVENLNEVTSNNITYSLDGVEYRSSGVFDGLLPGTFTVYIKDSFNCIKTVNYTIEQMDIGEASATPYFHYPVGNPIPMVRQKVNAIGENYGVGDLISSFEKNDIAGNYLQPFLNTDRPTLQVHTSYNNLNLVLNDCDGNEVLSVTPELAIKNINAFDSRDAISYTDEDGVLRIYFTTGNTYDEFGQIKVDEGHSLAGSLPAFYEIGKFIKVGTLFQQIVAIEFNDEFDRSEVITGDRPQTAVNNEPVIVSAYYNEQPYNVYEFPINLDQDLGIYQAVITYGYLGNDPVGEYRSEFIEVKDDLYNHHLIKYWSDGVKGLIFSKGFFGSIRVEYDSPAKDVTTTDSEQYQADDRLVSIDDEKLEIYEFDFGYVASNIKRQLIEVLLNDVVFIDGVQYKKVGDYESERLGTSNRYTFKATLQRQYDRAYRLGDYSVSQLVVDPFPVGRFVVSNGSFVNSNGLVVS
ncbi:hypothetical protein AAU57_11950 [Nonlabens sp. YIK11]|uniref:hypothetical protein n=1 Tax=Nonlabens sp. YIK11 TaxID=1453349 RepID=UPI0006DD1060|nr:hypothetical protein [Nonlabens sp. YIK11]KQC33961.1 hypothetical protein AAU57_11950 [Nonlabens sp. YIK11]